MVLWATRAWFGLFVGGEKYPPRKRGGVGDVRIVVIIVLSVVVPE